MEMTGAQILMETLLEQGTDVILATPDGRYWIYMSRFTETRDGFVMYCLPMSRGGFMRRMDMPEQQVKRAWCWRPPARAQRTW